MATLWTRFCPQAQSLGLNQLLSRQGLHTRRGHIYGGGWDLQELQRAADSLTALDRHLELRSIDSAQEAECISAALASCLVASVSYTGSEPCSLPAAVRSLVLADTFEADDVCDLFPGPSAQHAEAARPRLQHLVNLEEVTLTASTVVYTLQGHLDQLAFYPRLQRLDIEMPASLLKRRAAWVLSKLTGVEVRLRLSCFWLNEVRPYLEPEDITVVLRVLQGLPLHTLELSVDESLDSDQQVQLTGCNISSRLVLRSFWPLQRLERQLPGGVVEYDSVQLAAAEDTDWTLL